MALIEQIQGIFYSFSCAFLLCAMYSFFNRIFYRLKKSILRIIIQINLGILFGLIYFVGLVIINNGVLSVYFVLFFILGFFIYQHWYSVFFLNIYERIVKKIKILISPITFCLKKIHVILIKVKKVMKWQTVEEKE